MKLTDKDIQFSYPQAHRFFNTLRNNSDVVASDDNIMEARSTGETTERGRKWILTHWKNHYMKTTTGMLVIAGLMSPRMRAWLMKDTKANMKLVLDMTRDLVRDPNGYMDMPRLRELERKLTI